MSKKKREKQKEKPKLEASKLSKVGRPVFGSSHRMKKEGER